MIMKQVRDPEGLFTLSTLYRGGEVKALTPTEAEQALMGQVLIGVTLSENASMFLTEEFIMKVYHG